MNKKEELDLARELGNLTAVIRGLGDKLDSIESDLKDNGKILGDMAKLVEANGRSLGLVWKVVLILLGSLIGMAGYVFTH